MQTLQEPRRNDFDMAKLQKTLKQQQQRSLRARSLVTKLTPAEIRSLNNSIAASKSADGSSLGDTQRTVTNTPPLTPDNVLPTQRSTPIRNSISLPTPPQSPEDKYAQRQNSTAGNGTHIYSPIPQSHNKAGLFLGNNGSRPPSAGSSRGMPTYRGPEMTKTGSVSMLHHSVPTHQIVDNPLSQFSRPRQSRGSVSPTRQEQRQQTPSAKSETRSLRSQSFHAVENEVFPTVDVPGAMVSPTPTTEAQPFAKSELQQVEPIRQRAQTVAVDEPITANSSSRFSWNWRRRFSTHRDNNSDTTETKKNRGRPLSGARSADVKEQSVEHETTKTNQIIEEHERPKDEPPSNRTPADNVKNEEPHASTVEFDTHPAVRPLSAQSECSTESKGKGREIIGPEEDSSHDVLSDDSIPMYSRCACCGKLRKPNGARSLSPVLENENLKTNFSLEMERSDNLNLDRKRSSSSASRSKHTPIIPMMMAEGNTVQAKIAPNPQELVVEPSEPAPVVNERGDLIAPGTEPIALVPRQLEERDRKIVRFSSLYFNKQVTQQPTEDIVADKRNTGRFVSATHRDTSNFQATPLPPANSDTHLNRSTQSSDGTTQTRGSYRNYGSKYDDMHDTIPEEATGELMAAMNGVDMFWDTATSHQVKPFHEQPSDQSANRSAPMTTTTNGQSSVAPKDTSSTIDVVAPMQSRVNYSLPKARTRSVSFDPAIVEQPRMAKNNVSSPSYQKPRAVRNSNGIYQNGPSTTQHSTNSSQGITTRPKATAQFLFQAHNDIQQPSATSNVSKHRNDDMIDENNTKSYNPLPVPQLGRDFGQSNGNWGNYVLPDSNKHSNLVESVLAATNRTYSFESGRDRI